MSLVGDEITDAPAGSNVEAFLYWSRNIKDIRLNGLTFMGHKKAEKVRETFELLPISH